MKTLATAMVLVGALFIPVQDVAAQSPEMPVPGLVVKDADGKVMAQVFDLGSDPDAYTVRVVFNFQGWVAAFEVLGPSGVFRSTGQIVFTGTACSGSAYTRTEIRQELGEWSLQRLMIVGPDKGDGTYRVFRVTSTAWEAITPVTYYDATGECLDWSSGGIDGYPVGEVLPNPFEGFHGPTDANPERVLTIEGGTRLP